MILYIRISVLLTSGIVQIRLYRNRCVLSVRLPIIVLLNIPVISVIWKALRSSRERYMVTVEGQRYKTSCVDYPRTPT